MELWHHPSPQPPGEWTSRKSLLVSNLALPDYSSSDRPTARSETLWSSLGAHSGLSKGHGGSARAGDLAKAMVQSQASCRPRAPGSWQRLLPGPYTENARSLLQPGFLLWAQSQRDRELQFFVHLIIGGQEGSNRREEPEKSPWDAGIRGFRSPPVTDMQIVLLKPWQLPMAPQ